MTTQYDVLRILVRGGAAFHSEENQRLALLAVDAAENGFPDAESYQVELDKRAAAARREANPDAPETADERADRLAADNERLRALLNAQGSGQQGPAQPPHQPPVGAALGV